MELKFIEAKREKNKDYKFIRKTKKFEEIKVPPGYYSTCCIECVNSSCHDHC